MHRIATLGAYPSDAYYDPNRPGWMPYWIDTLSESAMKWGVYPEVAPLKVPAEQVYATPPAPVPASALNLTDPRMTQAPASREEAEATVFEQLQRAYADTIAQLKAFYDQEWERIEQAKPKDELGFGWVWIAAAAGVGVLLALETR